MSRSADRLTARDARQQVHHAELGERVAGLRDGGRLEVGIRQVRGSAELQHSYPWLMGLGSMEPEPSTAPEGFLSADRQAHHADDEGDHVSGMML